MESLVYQLVNDTIITIENDLVEPFLNELHRQCIREDLVFSNQNGTTTIWCNYLNDVMSYLEFDEF